MKAETKEKLEILLKNRFLLIFVCIFLSVVIIFGATLGIIMGVINSKAVVRYESTRLFYDEVVYLASVFKSDYIASLVKSGVTEARDTKAFWESDSSTEGKTQGDLLRSAFNEYISGIAIKNSLYLDSARFTSSDKKAIKELLNTRLSYLGYDGKDDFNTRAQLVSFDYDAMLDGSYLLYKSNAAFNAIYGSDGSNLLNYSSECEKYLKTYSHVALIFLNDKQINVLDENGNVTYNDDGEVVMRNLTDEEKAARAETAEKLRTYIDNLNNDRSGAITPETFELYMKEHSDTDPLYISRGYYFHPSAEMTAQFYEVYPEVVEKSLGMKIGEYAEVECEGGVCFIYRYDVTAGAYSDKSNVFFSDFAADGAVWCLGENIKALSEQVEFSDDYGSIDIVSIRANSKFVINSWG